MKAIGQDIYGSPDVLRLIDAEPPSVGDRNVLIRVRAAGVDPGVWHLMAGLPYFVRLMGMGLRAPKHQVPGMAFAGVVETVGPGVRRLRVGDEVFGATMGSFAELACASEDKTAPKPASLTFEQAAAVPVSGMTALQAVRDKAKVEAGQRVLALGAGGGVGHFAVQIAKACGAEVTGVCSTARVELVRSLGADHVIDRTHGDFTAAGPYDVILDIAGIRPLSQLRRALTPRGTLVLIGGEGGNRWTGGFERQLVASLLSPLVSQKLGPLLAADSYQDLLALADLIETGQVTPAVDRIYPLAEAASAVRYVHSGQARGKVVITM
jgi:NADPH:quinone reductase-like Zn-dependent oxidoreductase